jgi:hypothetical protein
MPFDGNDPASAEENVWSMLQSRYVMSLSGDRS